MIEHWTWLAAPVAALALACLTLVPLGAQVLAQDLTALHGKQLLALLRRLRAAQSNQQHYAGASVEQAEQLFGAAIAAVKAELATRPHIPNKQEAKALRQAAAKKR